MITTWPFDLAWEQQNVKSLSFVEFAEDLYTGSDVLIGAGNTELFVRDILGLDSATSPKKVVRQWKQQRLI